MKKFLSPILAVALMGIGCGPEEKPASASATVAPSALPSMGGVTVPTQGDLLPPPPPGATPVAAPKPPPHAVPFDLDQVNECLRDFVRENERLPTSAQELVSSGYLSRQLPVPAGKTLVVDTAQKRLVLADGRWQVEAPPPTAGTRPASASAITTSTVNRATAAGLASGGQSPAPPPGVAVAPPPASERVVPFNLDSINESLRDFVRENDRLPADAREMVASGYLAREPEPPTDKILVLDKSKKRFVLVGK